jgi:hypothetical protein
MMPLLLTSYINFAYFTDIINDALIVFIVELLQETNYVPITRGNRVVLLVNG